MGETTETSEIVESQQGKPSRMGDSKLLIDILREHDFSLNGGGQATPGTGIEIGVFRGQTSELLLRSFPGLVLYMVDPWKSWPADHPYVLSGDGAAKKTQAEHEKNFQEATRRTDFAGGRRMILRATSEVAGQRLAGRYFDFAFIDGAHYYEAVRDDIATWWPRVTPGGILAGHDLDHPRDQRGIWGVRRAVEEFCDREGLPMQNRGSCWWTVRPVDDVPGFRDTSGLPMIDEAG